MALACTPRRPSPSLMKIGTWNLQGRWRSGQAAFILEQDCDVLLLTEVSEFFRLEGYCQHATAGRMARRRHWAAVLSRRPLVGLPDPHPTSAMASIGDLTFCSSVLPWRSCGKLPPWVGAKHAEKTKAALDTLLLALPSDRLVWGGDFNQSLMGKDWSGSKGGCRHIRAMLDQLALQVPTEALPHRIAGVMSIDHIAVARGLQATAVRRVVAAVGDRRLSDHDANTLEIP